jgi:hypothetical protein
MLFTQNGARITHSFYSILIGINKYGLNIYLIRFIILYWIFFETIINRLIFPPEFRHEFFEDGREIEYEIRREIKKLENPSDNDCDEHFQ